jgi:hypothetical protein
LSVTTNPGIIWQESHLQENVLEFPSEIPDWDPIELPMRLRAGRLALRLLPPRERTAGGLLLPSKGDGFEDGAAAEQCRPDCGQVIGLCEIPDHLIAQAEVDGRSKRLLRDCRRMHRDLKLGDFVMVRPYSGVRWRHDDGSIICVLGFDQIDGDPWTDDAVMVLRGDDWRCLTNWALLIMEDLTASRSVLSSRHIYSGCGKVSDIGPDGSFAIGDRVATANDLHLQSSDDPKWLRTKWTTLGEEHLLVREVDANGTRRLIAKVD